MSATTDDHGNRQYSDEELLESLRTVHEQHGKVTIDLFNETDGTPASSVVINRFEDERADVGGWVRAKRKAGVGGDGRADNSRPREYTDEELLRMLQRCEDRHGRATQTAFDDDPDLCSSGTVVGRFGSWSAAKEEAGVE